VEDPDLEPGQVILISGHAEEDVADQVLNGSGGTASGSPSPVAG
jgi:hypothetical protein